MKATEPALLIIVGAILLVLHFISFHLFNKHYLTVGFLVLGVALVSYCVILSLNKKPSA